MQKSILLTATLAASFAFAATASAGTIAYEGFDYNSGAVSGTNGGTGWSAAWSGTPNLDQVNTSGITYSGLSTVGGKVNMNGGTLSRTFDTSSVPGLTTNGELGKAGTTVWFSFIEETGGWWGNSGHQIGVAFTDGGTQVLSIGFNQDGDNWALGTSLGDQTAKTDFTMTDYKTKPQLFVGKVQFGAGQNGTSIVDVWANPNLSGAAPTGGTHISDNDFQAFNFDGVSLNHDGNSGGIRYDEIRIGTDFASVISNTPVPEPASLALLGLGGLAMLRRRRRTA